MASNAYCLQKLREIAGVDFAIQLVAWAVAAALRTEKFYDATGALTYWTLILKAYAFANRSNQLKVVSSSTTDGRQRTPSGQLKRTTSGQFEQLKVSNNGNGASVRQKVVAAMVLVWSLRLGMFLGVRGWKYGDSRFTKLKHQPAPFLVVWMLQGFWCFITPLPAYLLLLRRPMDCARLGTSDYVAWCGWVLGFLTEAIADRQKSAWKAAGNTGFMQSGIWRYSQHPNYFGEIFLWICLTITSCNGLEGWPAKIASLASPAFTSYLLLFVSGVPLLQKQALKKYGKDAAFLAYRARTSLLVPLPLRAA